ncbi:MAG TPA: LysR family transcriptional regulator [Deltaproteobacteria bacterium]|nr:LysR family transcriptional regulator [Deltaproteobacteria bacterium]
MDRMRRVARVWNWLPAFRAVAETEHLPTAAAGLHVTPPALSRTLKVLQEDVGQALFDREGRGLKLNSSGATLLAAVRVAMRTVHDALIDLEGGHTGPLRVCSLGLFTPSFLVPTLHAVLDAYPRILPKVRTSVPSNAAADLLQGNLDVLFTSVPFFHRGLVTTSLGRVPNGIYCGLDHPLHDRDHVDLEDVIAYPFVAPPPDETGRTPEGWPPELHRVVLVESDRQGLGVQLCMGGRLLAVLPAPLAQVWPGLHRLPLELPTSTPLVAISRELLGEPGPVECAIEAAAAAVAAS